ncbi:SRPBCC family protein [Nocardioides sp. SOB77]|uniref:SRPBCC family protein n=1 Tax=Nocardioides oceani TaxID=3058369 RepID=A0ABT8FH41_9ACTN|nr:SRPBCC family protein [Nocardioides oceani]MDN4173845.1 SRPBCC family protein [Nocardioides oceani]
MTFEHEESATTTAPPAAVWALWSDVGSWHAWDPAVEAVALEGRFAEGAAGTMTLAGGIEVPFTLEVVEPGARYLDRLTMGELVIEIDHVVRADGDGAAVTVRTTISGPGAADIGPMVTRDAPVALERLAALAERG